MEAVHITNSSHGQYDEHNINFGKNEFIVSGVYIFLILYAAIIAPRLSRTTLKWFDNWTVQIALFFAIIYISTENVPMALVTAIAVIATLIAASNKKMMAMNGISFLVGSKFLKYRNSRSNKRIPMLYQV